MRIGAEQFGRSMRVLSPGRTTSYPPIRTPWIIAGFDAWLTSRVADRPVFDVPHLHHRTVRMMRHDLGRALEAMPRPHTARLDRPPSTGTRSPCPGAARAARVSMVVFIGRSRWWAVVVCPPGRVRRERSAKHLLDSAQCVFSVCLEVCYWMVRVGRSPMMFIFREVGLRCLEDERAHEASLSQAPPRKGRSPYSTSARPRRPSPSRVGKS